MERTKKVRMDVQAVAEKVKEHYGLPPDTKCKGAKLDSKSGKITFDFEHQTFDLSKSPPLVIEKPVVDDGKKGSEKMSKAVKKTSKKK